MELVVRNTLLKMVESSDKGWERLMTLRLHTSDGPITLISAYSPTMTSSLEAKDEFHTYLNDVIKNITGSEHIAPLGNFNARVEAFLPGFLWKWQGLRQRPLELCSYHGLYVCICSEAEEGEEACS